MNKQYLLGRMKEPSTWRGLILVVTSFGIKLSPDQIEAITFTGLLLAGFLGAALPDSSNK
jgi:hypothetical protein